MDQRESIWDVLIEWGSLINNDDGRLAFGLTFIWADQQVTFAIDEGQAAGLAAVLAEWVQTRRAADQEG